MDAIHLNKINELAREYLRLGIARSTTDAVEKARFQLSFEQQKEKMKETPYENLFEKMQEEKEKLKEDEEEINKDILGIQPKKNFEEKIAKLEENFKKLEDQYLQIIDSQNSKISLLENEILMLKQEINFLKKEKKNVFEKNAVEKIKENVEEKPLQKTLIEKKGISKTIEQTIKGRKITAEEVAVDKIFYFGNK